MYRVEQQLNSMDRKLDQLVYTIDNITFQQSKSQHYYHASGPPTLPPIFDNFNPHFQQTGTGMTTQILQDLQLPAGPSQVNTPVASLQYPRLDDDI